MNEIKAPLTGGIVIVCSHDDEAAALTRLMSRRRRTHFGLFHGYTGLLGNRSAILAVAGRGESLAYVAVRQLAFLFEPKLLLSFGNAQGLSDHLYPGDTVLVRLARKCYAPPIILEGMETDDDLVFSDQERKTAVLKAPPVALSDERVKCFLDVANTRMPRDSRQWEVPAISLGTMDDFDGGNDVRQFLSSRYEIDAVDDSAYGFFDAAQQVDIPAICLRVVSHLFGCDELDRPSKRDQQKAMKMGGEIAVSAAEELLQD